MDIYRGQPPRTRLVDVANRSGVTKSVASRVLNGDRTLNVRPETRARVLAAAQELAYRPHAGAKALAKSRTKAMALLVPDLMNSVYARIVRGAYERARELGYIVLLVEDPRSEDQKEEITDLVAAGHVEGLLIGSARPGHPLLTSGRLSQIPHVFVNRSVPGSGRNVTVDLPGGGAKAYDFLYDKGHRKLAHISGPADLSPARGREQGFFDAAFRRLMSPPPVVRRPFHEAGGYSAAEEIMERYPDTTAVFCGTFSQAVGALKAMSDMGKRVPEDVSLLSFDDLPLAEYVIPSLSAMSVPLVELGARSVELLVDQFLGKPPCDEVVDGPMDILERGSSGQPRDEHG